MRTFFYSIIAVMPPPPLSTVSLSTVLIASSQLLFYSMKSYFETERVKERETDQIHITFVKAFHHDCSILLLVLTVNLIYTLTFIIATYEQEEASHI